jgi:hypothetical protein
VIGLESLPRVAEAARRYFGADEIIPPGFILGLQRFEWEALQLIRWWTTGSVTIAANAGNVSHIEVFNPVQVAGNQPLLVVVTRAKVLNPVAATYLFNIDGAAAAVPAANTPLDTRVPGVQSQNRILNTTVGTSGVSIDSRSVAAGEVGEDFEFTVLPVLIGPSHRAQIWCVTQNQPLTVVMQGYEYLARSEEIAA